MAEHRGYHIGCTHLAVCGCTWLCLDGWDTFLAVAGWVGNIFYCTFWHILRHFFGSLVDTFLRILIFWGTLGTLFGTLFWSTSLLYFFGTLFVATHWKALISTWFSKISHMMGLFSTSFLAVPKCTCPPALVWQGLHNSALVCFRSTEWFWTLKPIRGTVLEWMVLLKVPLCGDNVKQLACIYNEAFAWGFNQKTERTSIAFPNLPNAVERKPLQIKVISKDLPAYSHQSYSYQVGIWNDDEG